MSFISCAACRAHVLVRRDGEVSRHRRRRGEWCPGGASEAISVKVARNRAAVSADALTADGRDRCRVCKSIQTLKRNGSMPTHQRKGGVYCEGGAQPSPPPSADHQAFAAAKHFGYATPVLVAVTRAVTLSCGHEQIVRTLKTRNRRRCRVCHQVSTVAA